MRNKRNILFLVSAIALFAVVLLFNQQRIHAEQTAVTATSNWREPLILTDETKNSVAPVLRQDSTGSMIVVYSSQLGGSVGNYTPFNRMWSGNSWTAQASLYDLGGDGVTPDVVYDTTNKAHAVWVNDAEQVFYADEDDWASVVNAVPDSPTITSITESAVAIDSSNNLHAVWQLGTIIYYATYVSNSWSTPVKISEEVGPFSITPAIAIDDSNTVHVVWTSYIGADQKIIYKNTPSGNAFPAAYMVLSGDVLKSFSPILLADGNRVHLSFTEFDNVGVAQQLHYVELTNSGGWGGSTPIAVGNTFYTNSGIGSSFGSVSNMAICGDALHLFYYGNTLSGLTERIWEISKKDGSWDDAPTAVTAEDDSKRAINPYAVCGGSSIHLVYEGIPGVGNPHTINYIYSSNSIYLPVILK